jgi:hypothetical protein
VRCTGTSPSGVRMSPSLVMASSWMPPVGSVSSIASCSVVAVIGIAAPGVNLSVVRSVSAVIESRASRTRIVEARHDGAASCIVTS